MKRNNTFAKKPIMKKFAFILALPLFLASCSNSESSDEKKEPTYEELVTKAITDFTKTKYDVEQLKLIEEVTTESVSSEIETLNEALDGYKDGMKMYDLAIASYESAKESVSKIDTKTFPHLAVGGFQTMNYDSLIQDINLQIKEAQTQIEVVELMINQYQKSLDNSDGKSPFTVFSAAVDAELRMFAVSPKGSKEVRVLFEINQ